MRAVWRSLRLLAQLPREHVGLELGERGVVELLVLLQGLGEVRVRRAGRHRPSLCCHEIDRSEAADADVIDVANDAPVVHPLNGSGEHDVRVVRASLGGEAEVRDWVVVVDRSVVPPHPDEGSGARRSGFPVERVLGGEGAPSDVAGVVVEAGVAVRLSEEAVLECQREALACCGDGLLEAFVSVGVLEVGLEIRGGCAVGISQDRFERVVGGFGCGLHDVVDVHRLGVRACRGSA